MADRSPRRIRFDASQDTPEVLAALGVIASVAGVFMLVERGMRSPVGLWFVVAGPALVAAGLAVALRAKEEAEPEPAAASSKGSTKPIADIAPFDNAEQGQFIIQVGGRTLGPADDTDEMERPA